MIQLTINEALLIVDALNGSILEPTLAEQLLWAEIEDAIHLDRLDQKWTVNGDALIGRLKALDNAGAREVVEKAEQFWHDHPTVSDARSRVLDVGLATEELVTASEAARLCGKSTSALSQLADRGKLVRYSDPHEPNPQRRTRYQKSQILALGKAKPIKTGRAKKAAPRGRRRKSDP